MSKRVIWACLAGWWLAPAGWARRFPAKPTRTPEQAAALRNNDSKRWSDVIARAKLAKQEGLLFRSPFLELQTS